MKVRTHRLVLITAAACLVSLGTATAGDTVSTTVLSLDAQGGSANGVVNFADVSATGKFVVFDSSSSDLISNDTNGTQDIFVRNTISGAIRRVSVRSNGAEVVGHSTRPSISADGQLIAFQSLAQLTPGDAENTYDIFVHDRTTGKTTRASRGVNGEQPDGSVSTPSISANGRFVAYSATAENLVPSDLNGSFDIFVFDRQEKTTERVSVSSDGSEGTENSVEPSISGNGRRVVFRSFSALSGEDDGDLPDIYLHDRQTNKTKLISISSQGYQANQGSSLPKISDDGKHVVFASGATNFTPNDPDAAFDRIYVRTLKTGKTELAMSLWDDPDVNGNSGDPDISGDGRFVVFETTATNIVPGDSAGDYDVYRHDRETGKTIRLSLATGGGQGAPDSGAFVVRISADGRYATFISDAEGLVEEETSALYDLFLRGPMAPPSLSI